MVTELLAFLSALADEERLTVAGIVARRESTGGRWMRELECWHFWRAARQNRHTQQNARRTCGVRRLDDAREERPRWG
ncbi:MAG TPA: hypothetical protein DCX80_08115 [Chloroflexi bacterium]|nr:hypothetical protein [Chloroflexota bacterium]